MKPERTSIQRWFQKGMLLGIGGAVLIVANLAMPYAAAAEKLYSYINEQGTPVLTDDYNSIPERYRAKVKLPNGLSVRRLRLRHWGPYTIRSRVGARR